MTDLAEQQQQTRDVPRERSIDHAAVAAFAHRAIVERNSHVLARAALTFASGALAGNFADLSLVALDATSLEITHTLEGDLPRQRISLHSDAIHAEAARRNAPVARALDERDYAAAPHLGAARHGAATAVTSGGFQFVMAVFSLDRPFHDDSLYSLQAIAAMYAGAVARCAAEDQLADRQRRLQLVLDQVPAIICTFDRNLVFTSVQGSALRGLGQLRPDEWIGKRLEDVGVPDGSPPVVSLNQALDGVASRNEWIYAGRTFENRVEPLRNAEGLIDGALNLAFDVTESRQAEAALFDSREQLRRLTAAINDVQETERRRIARQVHDELGQRMTALRLDLGLLRAELLQKKAGAAVDRIATMFDLVDETIDTVRQIASDLRPAVLDDFGLRAALEQELGAFTRRTGIEFTFSFLPENLRLENGKATALFRIIQEALTNVARHSLAKRVDVRIESCNGVIQTEVRDDGRGISAREAASSTTLGLSCLRERAWAVGGTVTIEGVPDRGTFVHVSIPQ